MDQLQQFLAHKAYNLRVSSLIQSAHAESGHPTSCLSAADIVAVLFFHVMQYDPKAFENPNADRFILSKGHASALLYAVWKEVGVLTEQDLLTYRDFDSKLEGHPTFRFPYTEAATGSLGIGLSIGVGEALAGKMNNRTYKTYVLMGDSEISEGSIWEAAQLASYNKLNNLIGIVDCNRLGQSTETMVGAHVDVYANRFEAFGFTPFVVDGHNIEALLNVFEQVQYITDKPIVIIAETIKGYGLDIEDKQGYHGKGFSQKELPTLLTQIRTCFADEVEDTSSYVWHPKNPPAENPIDKNPSIKITPPTYKRDDKIATRKAYGTALVAIGNACEQVVSLDAEVKNSTYAELFEQAYSNRFVQCFVAEQNMVSMGVGMQRRGKIPFISTFGAFLTRAHDQIRMAAIGISPLRIVGSHAGVSIGQDGPSQMALEDIALMRALPNSVVLYPSDATSTHYLVEHMANHHDGISYLRTTRMETPVLYDTQETFSIGGCKVLKESDQDVACVVAAGVTLHEALKAYELLKKEHIFIAVVDLYSIKPVDTKTLIRLGAKNNTIITVEDHYQEGGLGEAVRSALADTEITIHSLAVTKLPRSGKPEELLAWCNIDAQAIINIVKK